MSYPETGLSDEARARFIRWAILLGLLFGLLTFGSSLFRLQADYWWYLHDGKAPAVFSIALRTRAVLFVVGLLASAAALYFSIRYALGSSMIFGRRPESLSERTVAGMLSWTQQRTASIVKIAAPVIGIMFGFSLAEQWNLWLLFQNPVTFGKIDPIFGRDYAFFVFQLPFFKAVVGWLFGLSILCGLAIVGTYFGLPLMAKLAKMPVAMPSVRAHLTVMASIVLVLMGVTLWLNRYDAATAISDKFTGAGYTDLQKLGAQTIVCFALWISAAVALLNSKLWKPYAAIAVAVGITAAIYVVGVLIWPNFIQSYKVNPNALTLQEPYIRRALEATRWAYGLDKIRSLPFPIEVQPTAGAMKAAEVTLQNMRLWDPRILQLTVNNLQSLRDYYSFQDIDVDRYTINGAQRMLMLGARDLTINKLDANRRNWQNTHLQYTHGNGAVAVPVNESTQSGKPVFLLSDIPPQGAKELLLKEPRIYYSDPQGEEGMASDQYVLVRSKLPEFDYSESGEAEHRWTHDGGIPISGAWPKLVYSLVLGDKDILFSDAITNETRLLYHRSVHERARKLFPYLHWDYDPYITIVDGRLIWILDGYTTTDTIPYSALSILGQKRLNYVRNSIKLTIDAYTGEWKAYQTDAVDPIIKAYDKIYPGMMQPASTAPTGIREHFRYPEDLFSLQSLQLTLYHPLDKDPAKEAQKFFRNEDAWQMPDQSAQSGGSAQMSPYYVQMRLPNEAKDGFLLILPFTPRDRPNMIGWLAAHCDADDYGKLDLFRFPRDKNINGPAQQEASFQTDLNLSQKTTLIGQVGSEIIHGNLLVVPIGQSVMYVKTLFLVSSQQGIRPLPELKLIVLAFSNKIVFAESYARALDLLMGGEAPKPDSPDEPAQKEGVLSGGAAQRALQLMEEGKTALRAGDWAKYGDSQRKLERLLRGEIGI
ncbi:MAG: UPF0182 family protein [Armatimonadetes bacterium]|nr:UPF0182 family protein [Armatimonadota bacterium]